MVCLQTYACYVSVAYPSHLRRLVSALTGNVCHLLNGGHGLIVLADERELIDTAVRCFPSRASLLGAVGDWRQLTAETAAEANAP